MSGKKLKYCGQMMKRLDHETPIEELFEEQIQCADLVILSKADMLDPQALQKVKAEITPYLRAGTKIIASKNSDLPAELLLGIDAKAEDDLDSRPSHHDDGHTHDHDDFESFAVSFGEIADIEIA